jgi:multicomponent Na+:H+ antiporter subunit D
MAGDNPAIVDGAMITAAVPIADWLVIAPVALPIAFGAVLLMLRHRMHWHALIAVVGLAAMAAADAALLHRVFNEGPLAMTMGRWLPPFGIAFTADVLGAGFALVATLVALVCAVFAARDVDAAGRRYGFYPFLMLMMAGVSGAFLTGDIFNLYVWFEVFLISSFGLLILGSQKEQIDGATKYAILNLLATALFLIATAYLYGALGTLNMADIADKVLRSGAPSQIEQPAGPLTTIAALYLMAFGMKAAAFPVNFWLPASYHTPRMVVAALFGGLLTKVGIYALLRTLVMLFPAERLALSGLIGWVAVATMLIGALGALAQSDIRRMLGFLIISGVGIMLAGLAIGTVPALSGTIFYAVHSMLVTSALYLLVGLMKDAGRSFSLTELSCLYRERPLLAALALILFLAAAGLPPGSALWPKIMLTRASIAVGEWQLAGAILLSGFLTSIALGRVFVLAFWREARRSDAGDENWQADAPALRYTPVIALTLPAILIGVFPETIVQLADRAAIGLVNSSEYMFEVLDAPRG